MLRLLPLDGRPVCWQFPQQLAALAGLPLQVPPQAQLGQLKHPADTAALHAWLATTHPHTTATIASLDLLIHGGLIASRLQTTPLDTLYQQAAHTLGQLRGTPVHAMGSILRIPNYNNAEEEPAYWATYGQRLYEFSQRAHRQGLYPARQWALQQDLPTHVQQEMLSRRQRLLQLNAWWLRQYQAGKLASLVFGQDDTGPYGLNVQEATWLRQQLIPPLTPQQAVWVQTGADELAHTLLTRIVLRQRPPCHVYVAYTHPRCAPQRAKFDGVPVAQVVAQRLRAIGASSTTHCDEADWVLLVHGPVAGPMGDHCDATPSILHPGQLDALSRWSEWARLHKKGMVVADMAYANGADPALVEHLLTLRDPNDWLYGYAGWNTPGNAAGCAVAMGALRWWAQQQGQFQAQAWQVTLLTRLLDDWAYQAVVRPALRRASGPLPSETDLSAQLQPFADRLTRWLGVSPVTVQAGFPCQRLFECALTLIEAV